VSAQSPAQLVGAVLNGRWRLVRLLGEGGMGAVFEADGPPGVGKRAIKLLHQEYVTEELILARFFAEAQATRTLSHPNVAQVLETGTAENGTPYLVMELLQGIPVSNYTDQAQALPTAQAVHIIHGVLQALGAAHGRGIIHRDIKPDNLFLVNDANGSFHVKVLDFGIAKVMDVAGGMGQKTRTGVLLGTPGYMSPEQIKNSKGVDARADLWSAGIIFYELLTGISPFPADNEFARLTSVLTEEVKPIEQQNPHLASWGPFIVRALAKDPNRRFQSADEMAAALLTAARGPSLRPPPTLQGPQNNAPTPDWRGGRGTPEVTPESAPRRPPQHSNPHGLPTAASPGNAVNPLGVTTPLPPGIQQTAAMAMADHTSSIVPAPVSAAPLAVSSALNTAPMNYRPDFGPSPFPGQSGLMQAPTMSSGASGAPTGISGHSGLMQSPAMTPGVQQQSGLMPAPYSVLAGQAPINGPGASMQHVAAVSQGSIPPPRSGTIASMPQAELPSYVSGNAVVNVGPTHLSAQQAGPAAMFAPMPSIEVVDARPRPAGSAPYWMVGVVAFVAFGLGLALGLLLG
jgi:serine/threonine protein kinase